jgi:alpha-N-arabinofuranosidase
MKLLGIGNEQWGPQYIERYAKFSAALKAKHPEIELIAAAGPSPDDERFKFLWPKLRELKADIVDEHSYAPPAWFLDSAHRYDDYDRHGPKVFMGEYAAQSVATLSTKNRNTLECALAEAAFLTGLERNADVVRMASYAPLFGHVDAWQWTPNLLWTDNLQTLRTANYHVQALFAQNRGDRILPATLAGLSATEGKRFYASAVLDQATGEIVAKVVNVTPADVKVTVDLRGVALLRSATLTTLHDANPAAQNTFAQSEHVVPRVETFALSAPLFDISAPANSFLVLRVVVHR